MLVRVANREDPDHTASSEAVGKKQCGLGLHCWFVPVWQATSVQNFRTFMVLVNILDPDHTTPKEKGSLVNLVHYSIVCY